jgi:aldose 1-epimerase
MSAFSISHEGEGLEHVAILRDEEHGSEVRVAVGYGFNVFSFKVPTEKGVVDVLYAEEGFPRADFRATANGTPILVPFPNRIAGGKFTYDGKTYTLPCNDDGVNAIHGFAFDKPWRIIEEETDEGWARIVGEFEMLRDSPFTEEHWPGNFRVRCELRLNGWRLMQRFFVTNLSSERIPFGLGTHPYFRMPPSGDGALDNCYIESRAFSLVALDKTLPTGETKAVSGDADLLGLKPIGSRKFDDVYTEIEHLDEWDKHTLADIRNGVGVVLNHSEEFLYSVVYIPPHRKAICIEPYTCVTNAVNLSDTLGPNGPPAGLWHLAPAEVRTAKIEMAIVKIGEPERD